MENIVIYGGSFNPIHNGHIKIIKQLKSNFNKVIIVPSFLSPFKKEFYFTDAKIRLEMVREALAESGLQDIEVSDYEVKKEEISYSIDTVRHFSSVYKNAKLYFAIGSDNLKKLNKWHELETLATLATFYVIPRPSFEIKESTIKRYKKKYGATIEAAPFSLTDESSSLARLDSAFNKFDLVSSSTAKIIKENKLYSKYRDIVLSYPEFNLSKERIQHIYGACACAINLAKKYSANTDDATIAALCHDITKANAFIEELPEKIVEKYPLIPFPVLHAFSSAEASKNKFNIKKKAILDAIRFHTTAKSKMGKLAKIIFISDLLEKGRDIKFERFSFSKGKHEFVISTLDDIRGLTSLNLAVYAVLYRKAAKIKMRGEPLYFLTKEALEFYYPQKNIIVRPQTPLTIKAEAKAPIVKEKTDIVLLPQTKKAILNSNNGEPLAITIAKFLDDKKAEAITMINLTKKTVVADYFVIATASSTTAVRALTDNLDELLSKEYGIEPLHRDIDKEWAAIDYNSVIVHIQTPPIREYYNLERLWDDGTNTKKI